MITEKEAVGPLLVAEEIPVFVGLALSLDPLPDFVRQIDGHADRAGTVALRDDEPHRYRVEAAPAGMGDRFRVRPLLDGQRFYFLAPDAGVHDDLAGDVL